MQKRYLYFAVVVIIIVVAGALIGYGILGGSASSGLAAYDNQPVPASIMAQLQIPNSVANQVNATQAIERGIINPLSFPNASINVTMVNGKPYILYIGAEYCPYCAAERWALAVTLMRFGTFSSLHYMTSSATDSYANTPTFTFYNSTYTSPYITFVPVELTTNKESGGNYPTLQNPNSSENAIIARYDPREGIPFIYLAGIGIQVGESYDPGTTLAGMNWTTTAAAINNPSTYQAQAIVSTANLFTAKICEATNNTPSSVCSQPYVTNLEKS